MTEITPSTDRVPAVLTHVGGIFFGFIPSLIVYLVAKDDAWLKENARNALNFQITMLIGWIIASILLFVIIGIFLMKAIWAVVLIFSIIAAVKAYNGELYAYPLAIPLIK